MEEEKNIHVDKTTWKKIKDLAATQGATIKGFLRILIQQVYDKHFKEGRR